MDTNFLEQRVGPTLVEIGPAPTTPVYKSVYRDVRPGHRKFDQYIACKQWCKTTYDNNGYVYKMSLIENSDRCSIILYSLDDNGNVESTLRICRDSQYGLPIAASLPDVCAQLRAQNLSIAEPGRFAVAPGSGNFRRYVAAAYGIGRHWDIDIHLLQVRSEQTDFYQNFVGAQLLPSSLAPQGCTNLMWRLRDTPKVFFRAFGRYQNELKNLISQSGETL